MKMFTKVLSTLVVIALATATLFAQDGRTKVNFYNQTDSSLRFLLNGSPACSGDVIPNGFCTEAVNPGTYTASATNGQQTTGGQTFTIADGETYNYRVYVQNTTNIRPDVKLVLASAQSFSNNFFSASFNGAVEFTTERNDDNTSTMYSYESYDTNLYQKVVIRLVDTEIPEGLAATDFYANEAVRVRPGAEVLSRSTGTYQGHPFTYVNVKYTLIVKGNTYTVKTRNRFIYINAHEVYFVTQSSDASYDDKAEWDAFEASLNILK